MSGHRVLCRKWSRDLIEMGVTSPWPVEIRLTKDRRTLNVVFDDGASFGLSAELLRVVSPSAEVQGHSAQEPGGAMLRGWAGVPDQGCGPKPRPLQGRRQGLRLPAIHGTECAGP